MSNEFNIGDIVGYSYELAYILGSPRRLGVVTGLSDNGLVFVSWGNGPSHDVALLPSHLRKADGIEVVYFKVKLKSSI